ncbi:hypothetical protein A8F89_21580 [Escherichia coli]|nr:hypothetical protein A8F89_21580 [Escherichia coli]RCP51554.1 hypothetical protein APT26_24090 [Escherichia coli]
MREPVKSANDMKHFNFLFIYTPFVNDERDISRYYILTHNYEKNMESAQNIHCITVNSFD